MPTTRKPGITTASGFKNTIETVARRRAHRYWASDTRRRLLSMTEIYHAPAYREAASRPESDNQGVLFLGARRAFSAAMAS